MKNQFWEKNLSLPFEKFPLLVLPINMTGLLTGCAGAGPHNSIETCSGRKHFISKWNYAQELRFWINLIDHVTQHDFVDTNFGQSCSKIEIWFMFNCQTKRTIVALFIYPEIPPCWVFFGPGDRIFVCLHNCAIPHNSRTIAVFYCTICLPKPAQFPFFFRTLSEGLIWQCSKTLLSNFHWIICQVVAYRRLKTKENFTL